MITANPNSNRDDVPLRNYLEEKVASLRAEVMVRIDGNEIRYAQRFVASESAVAKAEMASDKRFDGVNEFRAALSDQQRTLMPRAENEFMHRAHEERINTVVTEFRTRIDGLAIELSKLQSMSRGAQHGWMLAVGAVGLILTIISILAMVGHTIAGH